MDGRIRLRQWLEGRLNTGFIPGLIWIEKSKGIFKIPWKHHSKHTWQEDDAAIFKDWAVVTGRYHEGFDSPDWPMWKTRLRCALNKAPDIQEVRQHHNLHCDEPFKVYRFISKTESIWRANATRHASLIFDGLNTNDKLASNTNVAQFFQANTSQTFRRSPIDHKKISLSKPITLIQKTEQGHIKLKYINIPVRITNNSLSLIKSDKLSVLNPSNISSVPFSTSSICSPVKTASFSSAASIIDEKSLSYSDPNIDLPSFKLSDVMEPEVHQVCLRIQHLEHRVSDMIVNNPNGCCIYFGRFDENLTSAGPEPIEPQIYQYVSESNKYCVDMLLDNMQRGVVLSILDGSIYAEKLCKCATFVYRPGNNGEFYFVDKLNRRDKMMIFDYRSFLEDLHYFQRGLGEKPHVELILAFGQQIKENSSPDSLYVWCRLASCKAWFLLQRAMMNGCKSVLSSSHMKLCHKSTLMHSRSSGGGGGSGDLIDFSGSVDVSHLSDYGVKQEVVETETEVETESGQLNQDDDDDDDDETIEEVAEELIEENVVDHLVYGENCLSDELGIIGVGQEVSIEIEPEDFSALSRGSTRFEETDLSYQFDTASNYDFK